jgi:hypothetical protein
VLYNFTVFILREWYKKSGERGGRRIETKKRELWKLKKEKNMKF